MVQLSPSQAKFVNSTATFPAFVGGFGSGKTAAAVVRLMKAKRYCPTADVAYYLPTYPLVEDIAFERIPALFERNGIDFDLNRSKSVMRTNMGRIIFRNMENPDRIVGYEVGHSIVDELDTLAVDKARNAWNKIIARNRQKCLTVSGRQVKNTVGVATTPEGFRFVYERWRRNPVEGYEMVQAKTMENAANLPPDYIKNLQSSYTPALLQAYLEGQFVNLTSGSVYPYFDRNLHDTAEQIRPREPLHIGMDFNVGNMAATVGVERRPCFMILEELMQIEDTPAMIASIEEQYKSKGHPIYIYPDASGSSRKTVNASKTDIKLLQAAGFTVLAKKSNPMVKDRIQAVNLMLEAETLRVNTQQCPMTTEALEMQAYNKQGEPDKQGGFDHPNDALGYSVVHKFGHTRTAVTLGGLTGI
tara:strand:+ start:11384 stop:12631 length:1248 start_codon:yes stop_codon:yes gene_type:complete